MCTLQAALRTGSFMTYTYFNCDHVWHWLLLQRNLNKWQDLLFEILLFQNRSKLYLNRISYSFAFSSTFDHIPSLTHQRLQLFVVRQVELSDKVIEMLVASVYVSLGTHLAHAVKVVDIDVDKDPKQTRQNLLSHLHERLREGSTWESNRWRWENTTVNPGWPFAACLTERHIWCKVVFRKIFPLNL